MLVRFFISSFTCRFLFSSLESVVKSNVTVFSHSIKIINAVYLPHQNKEELDIIIIYVAKLRELI